MRLVDGKLRYLLKKHTIVRLVGPHGAGKSWTALAQARSVIAADDESIRAIIEANPERALQGGQSPHVIDEWQLIPSLARAAAQAREGTFLMVSSVDDKPEDERHIASTPVVRLWPLSLAEAGLSNMSVSLMGLFTHNFYPMSCPMGLPEVAEAICQGGWPRHQGLGADASARLTQVLLQTVMEQELPRRGKRLSMAVKVACAHAACGWQATYEDYATYARDHGERPFSRNTARDYRQLFLDTYLSYAVEGWRAPIRSATRVRFKPRVQFVDPSLPATLLTHTPDTLLQDAPALLSLLRCLVLRDLNVYSSALEMEPAPPMRYYADSDGARADAVITLPDGRWGAINVTIGETQFEEAARGLTRLRSKLRKNPASNCPDPAFLAVIMGSCARPRLDKKTGVYAFPVGALAP
ncbi:DUF4143 domain-containing protein [Olsenella uli]|uniref:ATP-binding protein n=1 Tax=Olsenella uli TaxID=133926 RepID=UPI001958B8E4|nr:DUF4143 domain-containing protein [Olsenella uli]MBM6817284.1 DUF4143 domain-containing protein [Olsenella uli]